MENAALTVSALNEYVRRALAADPILRFVRLRGEISNFKRHISGHLYFSLKDEQSRIACVMFRQYAQTLPFAPRDGMRVVLSGSVALYTRDGAYQFYAQDMTQDGVGALYQRYELLKARLTMEGLFDAGRKRPLPLLPRAVGVVTSGTGAVLHDISRVAQRRNDCVPIILRPTLVQGEGAAADIVRGLAELAALPEIDVIIVGRGGGSLEDLWAFNEEIVARAVAACPVPVISAVGHETDVTLCDFAADVRAATPSAAAELAFPEKDALLESVCALRGRLQSRAESALAGAQNALLSISGRLSLRHPAVTLSRAFQQNALLRARMEALTQALVNKNAQAVAALRGKLSVLGPEQALGRGYAMVKKAGAPVTRAGALSKNDRVSLVFSDGEAHADIIETRLNHGGEKADL